MLCGAELIPIGYANYLTKYDAFKDNVAVCNQEVKTISVFVFCETRHIVLFFVRKKGYSFADTDVFFLFDPASPILEP